MSTPGPTPFTIAVPDRDLDDLQRRLAATRWPVEPRDAGWRYGANRKFMRSLVDHWRERYDWRAAERRLNGFPQFIARVGEYDIHYLHVKGRGPRPRPLMLVHGWPGSFVEFESVIAPLADPAAHGGNAEDAFDIIVPSIPGYGWSSPPHEPITTRDVAPLFDALMRDVLGYETYFVQGGDWGSLVASWLGADYPQSATAIHMNILGLRPHLGPNSPPPDADEKQWLDAARQRLRRESGYQAIQGTKPQTLAFGLSDSPAGLAAWIVEKFHGWSRSPGDVPPFSFDQLITNVMIYWATNSIASSTWLYTAARMKGGMTLGEGERVVAPTGFLASPFDLFPPPPDAWVKRGYNLVHRTDNAAGGHFAAYERGEDLVRDVRLFFRAFR